MLFEPFAFGPLEVRNRILRSATYESLADPVGRVTPELVKLYKRLGRGEIGTIVTGYMFVNAEGRAVARQIGIDTDETIPGLTELAESIQAEGSRAIFQLHHAGGQTAKMVSGHKPVAPSMVGRDPIYFSKPRTLDGEKIARIVDDFSAAARRARAAGADGVQIHAAHGYLLSQFLSPFWNRRDDDYGGSAENRYRILGEVIAAVREAVGTECAVLVKLNVEDGTPEPGMTTEQAAEYAGRLSADGVDGVEISSGSTNWALFVMIRGEVSVEDYLTGFPWLIRPVMRRRLQKMADQVELTPNYNAHAGPAIKAALGDVPLAVVGGVRSLEGMQELLDSGAADVVALSRPFVRQPQLVRQLRTGKTDRVQCTSCNQCMAGAFNLLPLACYRKGLPQA